MKTLLATLAVLIWAQGCTAQAAQAKQPTPFWTAVEEKEYKACLPHSLEVWKNRKSAEDYCLLDEEHKRWMRNHPQAAQMSEDHAKHEACLHRNAAKINGTLEEFRTAYDGCMSEAYGIGP
jgi:hypothetical protein